MSGEYFRQKTKLVFFQFLGLGLAFFALIFLLGLSSQPKILLLWQSLKSKLNIGCGCVNHFSLLHHPYILSSLIAVGIIAAVFTGFFIRKILKIRKATRNFVRTSLKNRKSGLGSKLKSVARQCGLERRIIELDEDEPVIFCFGFFRPRICISSPIVKNLSKAELTAVLLHEKYHLSAYDPIKLFMVKLLARILFFIPRIKSVSRQYLIFSELAADERATDGWKNKIPLSRALAKIIKWQEQTMIRQNLAVAFFDSVLEERVNKLSDHEYRPPPVFTGRLLVNIFIPLLLLSALNLFLFSTNKPVAFSDSVCLSQNAVNRCQMLGGYNCKMSNDAAAHFCETD